MQELEFQSLACRPYLKAKMVTFLNELLLPGQVSALQRKAASEVHISQKLFLGSRWAVVIKALLWFEKE